MVKMLINVSTHNALDFLKVNSVTKSSLLVILKSYLNLKTMSCRLKHFTRSFITRWAASNSKILVTVAMMFYDLISTYCSTIPIMVSYDFWEVLSFRLRTHKFHPNSRWHLIVSVLPIRAVNESQIKFPFLSIIICGSNIWRYYIHFYKIQK